MIAELFILTPFDDKNDKKYTAHWTPIDYTITYELNGGKNNTENPIKYNLPEKPEDEKQDELNNKEGDNQEKPLTEEQIKQEQLPSNNS